jgi:hypothetical protein
MEQLAAVGVNRGVAQRADTAAHSEFVTLQAGAVPFQCLAERTDLGFLRRHALATVLLPQHRSNPAGTTHAQRGVGPGAERVQERRAARIAPDLPDHSGHRADQVPVSRQDLLWCQCPMTTATQMPFGPGSINDGLPTLLADQLGVAACRALWTSDDLMRATTDLAAVEDPQAALPRIPVSGKPLRGLQRDEAEPHRAQRWYRRLRPGKSAGQTERVPHMRLSGAISPQSCGQTLPAGTVARSEHRAHPQLRTRQLGQQPRPTGLTMRRIDAGQPSAR